MLFSDFYDTQWLKLGGYFAHHRKRFSQTWDMIQSLPLPSHGTVFDVGGIGPLAAYLNSERGWQMNESKVDLRGPLPFDNAHFDLVICTETIEHIKDVDSLKITDLEVFNYSGIINMLCELRRVLSEKGFLIVTTPNANSMLTLDKWLYGEILLMDPQHIREFTVRDLSRVATLSGLCVHNICVVDSWEESLDQSAAEIRQCFLNHLSFTSVDRGDNILAVFCKNS
jgi:SAM-dependent methyltransferase